MQGRRGDLLTKLALAAAIAIISALLIDELSVSKYDGCMSVRAYSKAECERYVRR